MEERKINISVDEYIRLSKDSLKLLLLEQGGVDNWEWYGESLNPDCEDFDDIMKEVEEEIEERIKNGLLQ